jgi:hypothetical protein
MDYRWNDTDGTDTQVLAEQSVPISHWPPQLPHGLATVETAPTLWDSGARTPESLHDRFCSHWPAKYKALLWGCTPSKEF